MIVYFLRSALFPQPLECFRRLARLVMVVIRLGRACQRFAVIRLIAEYTCCSGSSVSLLNVHSLLTSAAPLLDCKTVVFFANAGDRNERRSGSSVKTARENGESPALHNRRSQLPKTTVLQSTSRPKNQTSVSTRRMRERVDESRL